MCQGDDPNCAEFEQHRLQFRADMAMERASGMSPRTAAAAVSRIGRARRTVASTMASAGANPARTSCSI